ncbi:hypothetical protein OG216_36065 [Streptomycetaceae bacterium NBC_01309]
MDLLVPELLRRGRYKRHYEPGTLRHKLTGKGGRIAEDRTAAHVKIPTRQR